MALVTIPTTANPWSISINNVTYGPYSAGEEVEVPEVVAEFIEAITPVKEEPLPPMMRDLKIYVDGDNNYTLDEGENVNGKALCATPFLRIALRFDDEEENIIVPGIQIAQESDGEIGQGYIGYSAQYFKLSFLYDLNSGAIISITPIWD